MGIFNKKEVKRLVFGIFILALVFGFNDKAKTFAWNHWLTNFILVLIIVAISFLLKQLVIKLIAKKYGCNTEFDFWKVSRFWFKRGMILPDKIKLKIFNYKINYFPLGIILPLLVTLFSNGLWYFPVIGSVKIIEEPVKRIGRIFVKVTGIERAIIYFSGIGINLLLALIFSNLAILTGHNFDLFININIWLAVFGLLPLSNLEGLEMLFGSLPFYIFSLAFVVLCLVLIKINFIFAIIFSIIAAFLIVLFYLYIYNKK